jgi:hypothetical protein
MNTKITSVLSNVMNLDIIFLHFLIFVVKIKFFFEDCL